MSRKRDVPGNSMPERSHPDPGREEDLREIEFAVAPGEDGARLDHFLSGRMTWRSRSSIQKLLTRGRVRLGEPQAAAGPGRLKASLRVRCGQVYAVRIPIPRREEDLLRGSGGRIEIPVLYEDRWVVAVNKPPGIAVHPAGRILDRTVITEFRRRCAGAGGIDPADIKLCHRLDLETSGVLLLSRDPVSMPEFAASFEQRRAHKEYLALVHGAMRDEEGLIDLPIGPARDSAVHLKRAVRPRTGRPARTGFRVERRFRDFTLVRLILFTGRHHQIRVHLAARGHPIVGDKLYGEDETVFLRYLDGALTDADRRRLILPRQALHAAGLRVPHPRLGRDLCVEAPLFPDMLACMAGLVAAR